MGKRAGEPGRPKERERTGAALVNKRQYLPVLTGLFITALVLGATVSAAPIILPDAGTISGLSGTGTDPGNSSYPARELVPYAFAYTGRSRYSFRYNAASGSWYAENQGQRIGMLVTKSGQVTFLSTGGTAGFRLAGIGRAREVTGLPAARIHTDGDRLELSHGAVTEWYMNGENGIEQGMTLHSRPAGNGTLLASFNLEGDLRPVMAGQSLVFFNATGPTMYYGGLAVYDATGRDLPATISLSSGTLRWEIDDRDAVYPVVIDPWIATQAATLTASDAAGTGNAWFGNSVAVSGDGKTAIIGAEAASFGEPIMYYAGQSYVFTNSGGTWPHAILNASDKASEAQFGHSVAISGDGNTAIIGAPYATWNSQVYAGQAYIFKNSGGEWSEAAILNASDAAVNARFGSSVAISDDGNTVLIGAYRATGNSQALAGQAYIFRNSGVEWSELAILNASGDAKYMAWFGDSAALSGDKSTAIIGARGFNSNTGKAYIFTSSEGEWHQSATPLTAPDGVAGDSFGYSVAISDDGNTALIGAPNSGSGTGKAYIFTSSGGTWSESATLTAPDAVAGDNFGYSVAVSGDTAVVGAFRASADILKTNSGKAYVFKRSGTAWTHEIVVIPSDAAKNDYFGYSVALSGEGVTSAIGAYGFNTNRGKAYVFDFLSTAPQVYGIAPSSWPNTSYRTVVVSGNGFSTTGKPVLNLTRAGYSNISLTNTFPESAQSFSVSVPHHIDAGIWNVTVINPDGEEGTNASVTFTVTAPPILDGISPTSGQNTGTTLVTVTGIQFNCTIAPTVNLTRTGYNNITMTATNLSTTSFTVSVPSDLDKGVWNFVIINPDGLEGTNAGVTFTVIAPPRLTGISPTCGADAPSTTVTITGSYFDISTAPVVNLSSAGQTNITLTPTEFSATSLKVTVPNNNIDAIWNITVINPDGLEGTNASVTFSTIDPPPVADFSFEPAEGIPPLTVTFTDKTSNAPDSWLWDFGDGDTTGATDQNPVHTYTKPGRYTVSLSATNSEGTGTKTARKAITVFMPLTPVTVLNAGSHAADDDLSWTAVALSQDGNTAILGGGWITIGTTPPGKAWVFQKDGGTWNWVQALIPSESAESDLFGDSIAISDDGNTALIAADNANIGTELESGKVYVFTNSGGTWSQSQILMASDHESSGHFGQSLAMSGDGNTALIGAYMAGAGKAYVFRRTGGVWSENKILISSDLDANDFGFSAAVSDDGNTALIGAPDSNVGAIDYAGKVYTFTRNGEGIWSEKQVLTASVPNETAHFGWSVAISGDGNTAVIGAPNYKIPAPEEFDHKKYPGQAYVFTRDGGGIWSEKQALNNVTDSPRLEEMGGIVAISDDGNTIYIDHSRLEYRTRIYQNDGESWYITHALIPPSDDPVHFVGSVVFHGPSIFAGTKMNKTTADGTGQAYFFTLSSPAPVVAGISPSSGTNTKDNPVTITGTNFDTGSSPVVKLTRSGYADVTLGVVSGTGISLVRTVPAHVAAGTWNVVVTNPDGQSGTSASVTYTVTAPPSVSSVIPATGLNTGPVSVGITGSQFNTNMPGGTTLNLTRSGYSNISVFGISPASATGFSANIPITGAGAGTWYIVVVNPDGQESTESIPFRITGPDTLAPPSVSSVSPATGLNTGTMTAVIAGTGFNTTMPGGTTLNLTRSGYSNISVFGISPVSATGFSANIPITGAGAGTWYIVVVNPDGQESMEIIPFVITSPDSAPTLTPTATATTTMTNPGSSGSGGSTSTGRHYTSTGHGSNPAGESKSPLSLGNNNGNGAPPGASGPAGDSGSTGAPGGTSQSGTGLPLSVTTALIGAGGIGIAGSAWYIRQWRIEKRENDPLWWRGGK